MKVFRIVAVMALLTGPAYAQTLIQSFDSKTPQQKADDALREKSARESQKTTPGADAKPSVDAWGNVRGGDAAKTSAPKSATSKSSGSKTATSAKPRTKTGTDAD
jgi:hypothetical protein